MLPINVSGMYGVTSCVINKILFASIFFFDNVKLSTKVVKNRLSADCLVARGRYASRKCMCGRFCCFAAVSEAVLNLLSDCFTEPFARSFSSSISGLSRSISALLSHLFRHIACYAPQKMKQNPRKYPLYILRNKFQTASETKHSALTACCSCRSRCICDAL